MLYCNSLKSHFYLAHLSPFFHFKSFLFYHLSIHPSIREGDFCSKTLQPSIIPHGKKNAMTLCPWWTQHWFFLSCLSHTSHSPSPLTPSLSPSLCLSPIPSHPSLPQRAGSLSDSLSLVPFHAAQWLALHYSANILHLFLTPTHSWMRTYIQTGLFNSPIRLTALLKLPRT